MTIIQETPARKETIRIKFALDKSAAERHWEDLRRLGFGDAAKYRPGDEFHLSYSFDVHYFGQVAENLESVLRLASDKKIVNEASIEELQHGRSIVVDVVKKLDRLIRKLDRRKS